MVRVNARPLVVLSVAGLLAHSPAFGQIDISGAWIVSVESPQGATRVEASFKQAGEQVTGEVESPGGNGKVEISGTLVKNDLRMRYTLPGQGSALEVKMTGQVEGDTMKGSLDFGGVGQAPWTAKRKPAEGSVSGSSGPAEPSVSTRRPTGPNDITGRWTFSMRVQLGAVSQQIPMDVSLAQSGESVSGTVASPGGPVPLTGTMAGKRLTLEFKVATPQGEETVTLNGELGTNGLKGKTTMPGLGDVEWTGTRVP